MWWNALLIGAVIYTCIRMILGRRDVEYYLWVLFSLISVNIWRFGQHVNLELSPILFVTIAVLFFCFSIRQATMGVALLLTSILFSIFSGTTGFAAFIWVCVLGLSWGLIFTIIKKERENILARAADIERRAREFMNTNTIEKPRQPEFSQDTQIAKAASVALRIESLVRRLTEIVNENMHPNSCFYFYLDQEFGLLRVLTFQSRSRFFNRDATIDINSQDILSWVIQNKKQLRHESLAKEMQFPSYYFARERILSCMVIPVIHGEVVEGILGVDSKRSHSFGVDEERIMTLIADLISDLIDTFRNYQEKDNRADYMEMYYYAVKQLLESKQDLNNRLALLLQISEMLKKSDEIAVATPDDEYHFIVRDAKGTFTPKLVGLEIHPDSLVGEVIQKGLDIGIENISDVNEYSKVLFNPSEMSFRLSSIMVIPLPLENRIQGILILGSRKKNAFSEQDKFIFNSLAVQFGFILEHARISEKLEKLAITDGLTNLSNHRAFQDRLDNEILRARRDSTSFSLLLIDIDHFKSFNDYYGYEAGDYALKKIAGLLKREAREVDFVGRYGGEEFVLILINCDLKMAARTGERIRRACLGEKIEMGEESTNVTLSIGVSSYPTHSLEATGLLDAAIRALSEAKTTGRNKVVIAQDTLEQS